jgi:hypothetical protein
VFEEEDTAVERRVGRSSTSERRSIFRESKRAFRRLSSRGFVFSARRLYVSLKVIAASSSLGSASRREAVDCARAGRVVRNVDRCVADSITDLCDRLESAWREIKSE